MRKFTTSTSLLFLVIVLLIAGCSQGTNKPADNKEPVEIIVWTPGGGSEDDAGQKFFQEMSDELKASDNITIKVEPQLLENYLNVIVTAGVAQSGFDIAFDWSGPTFEAKVKKGIFMDISDKVSEQELEQMLGVEGGMYQGKLYGLPYQMDMQLMFYNKSLFEKAGVTPEEFSGSWEGLKAAAEKLKNIGVSPMAFANKEGYMNEWHFFMGIGSLYKDNETYVKEFIEGDGHQFNDPRMLDIINNYKYAYDNGFFFPGATLDFGTNYIQSFMNQSSAVAFCGLSWYDQIKEAIGEENVGVMPWFSFTENAGKVYTSPIVHGVSSFTKHPEEALKVLQKISSKESADKVYTLLNKTPTHKAWDINNIKDNPVFQEAVELRNENSSVYPYNYSSSESLDIVYKEMSLVLSGDLSPEEWLKKMHEAQNTES